MACGCGGGRSRGRSRLVSSNRGIAAKPSPSKLRALQNAQEKNTPKIINPDRARIEKLRRNIIKEKFGK